MNLFRPGETTSRILAELPPAERTRWWAWLLFFLVAAAIHLVLLRIELPRPPARPAPVRVQEIDPAKLAQIRRQWRAQDAANKKLLLNKDPRPKQDLAPPPDARYMSDRNIRVEREQRARQTDVIPRPGAPSASQRRDQTTAPPASPESPESAKTIPRPKNGLGRLGVPIQTPPPMSASPPGGGAAGADQSIDDPTLSEGSENLLNAQESVYYSFYARIYETIGPLWQSRVRDIPYRRRVLPNSYTTRVDVVLDGQGNLLDVRLLEGSGVTEFDQAVNDAWKKVGRFPNPPRGLLDPQGEVHTGWTFTVHVGTGVGIELAPPARDY